MQNKVEGIILNKCQLKGRNVLSELLLRNGQKMVIVFYGAIGGGKSQKSGIVEVGNMLEVCLRHRKNHRDLLTSKEFSIIWSSKFLRYNHKAFYLACSFFEILSLVTISPSTLSDDDFLDLNKSQEHCGIFNILSNSLYYIDKSLEQKIFNKNFFILYFFERIIRELGVLPQLDECLFCQSKLKELKTFLSFDDGGFICQACNSEVKDDDSILIDILNKNRKNIKDLYFEFKTNDRQQSKYDINKIKKLISYFLFQFNLSFQKVKSLEFVLC